MRTVFLSYAHADNLAPEGEDRKGWVNYFDSNLRIELSERGVDVRLWRDKRDFDPMGVVNDTLKATVGASELFVAVLSPRYVLQTYCIFELDAFVKKVTQAGGADATKSILLVLKRPLPDEQYPPAIRGMGYVPFFELDRATNEDTPFYDGFGRFIAQKYWESIRKVGGLIKRHLAEPETHEQGLDLEKKETVPRAIVYLSACASDLSDEHWSVRKELESQSCRIVPSDPWPKDAEAARQHLRDALQAADFSVHMLGATSGSDAASGLIGLAKLQLDLAAERTAQDPTFRRLIWLLSGLQPSEDSQKELIKSLEAGNGLLPQDELVQSGLENFKEVVRDELASHDDKTSEPIRLYLVCEAPDEADALTLRPLLVDGGFEVELPEFGPDGAVPREDHERCLLSCDVILFYWGRGTEGQIRRRFNEIDGAVSGLRQGKPYTTRALYLAPPATPRKTTFASHLVDVLVRDTGELRSHVLLSQGTRAGGAEP
ncbi:MAG: toll/interleukin-1 receptor domain-containing protein [bacterium]